MNEISELALEYVQHGLALIRIPSGKKGPTVSGWQLKDNAITTAEEACLLTSCNLGIAHLWSTPPTCVIDIDDFNAAKPWFASHDLDIDALLDAENAVRISSGREGRGKLLYRLPDGTRTLPTLQPKKAGIELRCGNRSGTSTVQDVLPPSMHPDTGNPYKWAGKGDWKNIPAVPDVVLELWNKLARESPIPERSHSHEDAVIQGSRNNTLTAIAGTMRRRGLSAGAISIGIQDMNAKLCNPPLPENEVSRIAQSVAGYPAHSTLGHVEPLFEDMGHLSQVDLSEVRSSVLPELGFIFKPLLPRGEVTLLGGHGGIGKSMLALTLAAHAAAGRPWAHFEANTPVNVSFLSLEDKGSIILPRLRSVLEIFDLPDITLRNLHVYDCADGCAAFMIETPGSARSLETTNMLEEAKAACAYSDLVVVDNASDAFDGNENVRRQVRQFVRSVRGIGKENNAAVLMLAHIDKAAALNGSKSNSYSGSTAWHNSARSRLALGKV